MKKTSLYLEPELDLALARKAAKEKISKAKLMRRALLTEIREEQATKISAIGVGEGPGDVADKIDNYLKHGFGK